MRKDYSLKPLHCEHLVVGAGSTGLAVVDHLLRREQGSVILVDSLDSPQAGPTGGRTPLLSPGEGNWSLLVDRARELYEGWSDWIEVDPQLRRCGVLLPRVHGNSLEALDSADSMRRWSKLSDSGPVCAIDDCAATVDAVTVASALMWRIRKAGGNFYPGSALSTLVEEADAVHFSTGIREGVAEKVYLCTGASSLHWLEKLGIRHPFQRETVSIFTLQLDEELPPIIQWQEDRAILFDRGDGFHELRLYDDCSSDASATPAVNWDRFAAFRDEWMHWIPLLEGSEALKARAVNQIACPDTPPLISSAGGRVIFPGACGESSALMFPALAEQAVELQLSGNSGGLLEEPSP